jgi:hypothetical protein
MPLPSSNFLARLTSLETSRSERPARSVSFCFASAISVAEPTSFFVYSCLYSSCTVLYRFVQFCMLFCYEKCVYSL